MDSEKSEKQNKSQNPDESAQTNIVSEASMQDDENKPMEAQILKRVFKYEDEKLEDPNPNMSPQEVLKFYSALHPELTNGSVSTPKIEDDKQVFTLSTVIGTKG